MDWFWTVFGLVLVPNYPKVGWIGLLFISNQSQSTYNSQNETNPMKTYLDETLQTKLKELRTYESETYEKWGSRKRIFKIVGVNFEIKFCRAEMLLKDILHDAHAKKKLQMVEMMIRAFDSLNIECEKSGYNRIQPSTRCFNFDKKTAIVCDTDDEKPVLYKVHKNEPDIMIFSVEELLRSIPQDFMEAKALLSKLDKSVNFKRIDHV